MDIKLESEDANFAFPEVARGSSESKTVLRSASNGVNGSLSAAHVSGNGTVAKVVGVTRPRTATGVLAKRPQPIHQGPITLTSQLSEY